MKELIERGKYEKIHESAEEEIKIKIQSTKELLRKPIPLKQQERKNR